MRVSSLFLILFLTTSFNISCQIDIKTINSVILIDNELIDVLEGSFNFVVKNSTTDISFGYEVGQIKLTTKDYQMLLLLNESETITVKMEYTDLENGKNDIYKFKTEIKALDLRQRYIVFRMFNCKEGGGKVFLQTPRYHTPYPIIKKGKRIKCN
jgi:hypothetical protein